MGGWVGGWVGKEDVPAVDGQGNRNDEDDQVDEEDGGVVVLLEEEGGEANGDFQGLFSVRVAVLLPVLLGHFVREGFVGFADHHEHLELGGWVGGWVGMTVKRRKEGVDE